MTEEARRVADFEINERMALAELHIGVLTAALEQCEVALQITVGDIPLPQMVTCAKALAVARQALGREEQG